MAKLSYNDATKQLELIASTTTAEEFVYDLLRIFGGVTDTSINRIKEGKGNMAKDGVTVLAKFGKPQRVIAYRPAIVDMLGEELEILKSDKKVLQSKARLLVVSDGRRVMAYDPKEEELYDNHIATLWKDFDFFMPLSGVEKFQNIEENEADVKASYIMAKIYDDIRRYNDITSEEQVHSLNVFLTRLLFCFFAEDTGIFEEDLFTGSVQRYTQADGSDLKDYIEGAFDIMSIQSPIVRDNMPKAIRQFPYVNGGLFKEHFPMPRLSRRTRDLILKCGGYQWQEINPDIFGSMIQAVIRPEDRAGLGLHYTSVPNILKVIRPLFLDALYEEFVDCKDSIKKLDLLLIRLSKIKFFDPACGSGNFLIIAYKELRKLELQIWQQMRILQRTDVLPFTNISLTQFYGIEIDEFAQETATLSLWLAEHQMNKVFYDKFGTRPDALPLRASGHIVHGNACRLDWNAVCPHAADEEVYVMGNPPYLGSSKLDKEQQDDRAYAIGQIQNYKKIDYIGIWLIKGTNYIKSSISKCAFVSTNSICQGEMVEPLWTPIFSKDVVIDFAYTSFKWGNNAKYNAGVTCVIIGLANNVKQKRTLITGEIKREVVNINPYLTEGSSLIVSKHNTSISLLPKIIMGCKPTDGGNLLLTLSEKEGLVAEHPQSEKYVKKLFSAADYINGLIRFCLWISDEDRDNAESLPFIRDRIKRTAEMRLKSPDEGARNLANKPHQFREFNACDTNTLIIPSTSSANRNYIPMGYADGNTVVTNAMYSVFNAPLWVFGVVTSVMSMLWMKTIGGRLKTDYRYTNLCYNSFPFPKISEQQRKELEEYAEEVLLVREEFTELTLAQMYDPDKMPQRLRDAHR
ncbi:MAG: class I SAM-dependent DNA methyltransferase, partial [Bacteroides sp.]|uniref:DNA methyltransferase n=1 Tax=Bacteroides sp. TaxID=29523 RepID=UPI001B4D9383